MGVGLSGCSLFEHVTVVPTPMVVACLNEAYQESDIGLGPQCSALAAWARSEKLDVLVPGPGERGSYSRAHCVTVAQPAAPAPCPNPAPSAK
jgi:hypothetical protein